jgi:hypothetical protein
MAQIPSVPFQTPTNLFRFGEQSIWSTALLPTVIANTQTRIFSTANGQVGQGFALALSIAETNLKEGGKTPAGVAYDVFGVASEIVSVLAGTEQHADGTKATGGIRRQRATTGGAEFFSHIRS